MIVKINDNWELAERVHNLYINNLIDDFINLKRSGSNLSNFTVEFLKKIRSKITSKDILDLQTAARYYSFVLRKIRHKTTLLKRFIEDIKSIFNYTRFSRKKKKSYDAYDLCNLSKARICPYCHHSYVFTVLTADGAFRPTLDHFFNKDDYPILALSLYNLVPACSTCNSSLKASVDFLRKPHLHPFYDDESFNFTLSPSENSEGSLLKLIDLEQRRLKISIDFESAVKSNASFKTFIIEHRYQRFVTEAVSFAKRKLYFNELMGNTQIDLISEISEEGLLGFDKSKYKEIMLGKLYVGIYDQYNT
jgi:hypothetical protein